MKKISILSIALFSFPAIFFTGCKKEKGSSYYFEVHLTDAPAAFEEVNVDIQQVKVKLRDDSAGWVSLNTNAGIYNLLGLQNGVDTLLAAGILPANFVKEIRLYLGSNNSVKINGQVHPLLMNNGDQPKLMIKVDRQISQRVDSLVVDFDAGLSVIQQGNGGYRLIPVLRVK
jgi:hypothetical protein